MKSLRPLAFRSSRHHLAGLVALAMLGSVSLSSAGRAAGADGQNIILYDGFEGTDFAPAGGLYYKNNREQGAGTHTFQSEVVRSGKGAVDLSVRPQCPPDNELCSERAEVWEKPDILVRYGDPVWYAFSMKMAEPIPPERHRYVMAQWKREIDPGAMGDYSPLLALRLMEGRLAVTIDTDTGAYAPRGTAERPSGCRPGEAVTTAPDEYNQFRALVAIEPGGPDAVASGFGGCTPDLIVTPRGGTLPALASGWVDFVFLVKPGPKGDGRIEIVVNDQWIATITGKIGHEGPQLGEHLYFKFGPYRAGRDNIWRIYYDEFRRGPACTDVAPGETCAKVK
ncbi:polysaccharide lyase [Ancylobacter sp. SL191]|uniref:polysaccharide lyase n=1 Tax=Ancylobacter sp. SL191 TaxID=2995166 RepID=UPI00227224A0|nr:polysaccharide lyase [Ancylobacter sp. SL191]WAC27960.1 polysaccharide lyase [Ancylobacter sp. SL191]